MMKTQIKTTAAPQAMGPYSQGILVEGNPHWIFVSGQVPIDPATGKLVTGAITVLTDRVIDNIEAILKEAGSSLQQVVRVDVFLKDLKNDFNPMNEVYAQRFGGSVHPARQTVQVSELPLGAPIEISCIAFKN